MENLYNFLISQLSSILPAIIAISLAFFTTFGKKLLDEKIELKYSIEKDDFKEREELDKQLETLIQDEETNLELLEEIWVVKKLWFFDLDRSGERVYKLSQIQDSLRNIIRSAIGSDSFSVVRSKSMKLIQEAQSEIDALQELKPFDGLGEPEKSLLVDLLEELPENKPIPKQKALQLADIIKIKHQETLKLQRENAKSSAWTKWGTAGTVFFGILSIVLSIYLTK